MKRVILHSDMNCFYAAVECLDNPKIRHLPVAVCGSIKKRRGIVMARNEHAKKMGVQTAEPVVRALEKCPNLHIVPPRRERYKRVSNLANGIYRKYTDLVQPFGIDESWIDITQSVNSFDEGLQKADEIRQTIYDQLGVTVSIGASWNRVFAKLGSDVAHANRVAYITKDNYKQVVWPMETRKLLFVGPATERRLAQIGINTIGEIAQANPVILETVLGKWGTTLYAYAKGQDGSQVVRWGDEALAKGIGNSTTTPRNMCTREDVKQVVYMLSESVAERMRDERLMGRTVQLWLRDTNLQGKERQMQLPEFTQVSSTIAKAAMQLVDKHWKEAYPLRSLGVRMSNLSTEEERQLNFLSQEEKKKDFEECIDDVRGRFGHWSMRRAISLVDDNLNINPIQDNDIHPQPFNKVVK